jgi:hypothetical protein
METKTSLTLHIQASLICLLICSCATTKDTRQYHTIEKFNAPYDEVWSALNWVVFDKMDCTEKKVNKKKGIIETEWVYIIGMDGTTRWKITARAEQHEKYILVQIDKKVQLRDEVSKSINMYREKTREKSGARAGWKTGGLDQSGTEEIYLKIKNRLKNNALSQHNNKKEEKIQ